MQNFTPVLIQDTREQWGYAELFEAPCTRDTLPTGDYSIAGLTDQVAIERKSLPDLVASLTQGRERFQKELARSRPYRFFGVIIEASAQDILQGRFNLSCANPKAIWESISAFTIRYCPFFFANDRLTAAKMVESLLLKFAREHWKATEAMRTANVKALKRLELDNRAETVHAGRIAAL